MGETGVLVVGAVAACSERATQTASIMAAAVERGGKIRRFMTRGGVRGKSGNSSVAGMDGVVLRPLA